MSTITKSQNNFILSLRAYVRFKEPEVAIDLIDLYSSNHTRLGREDIAYTVQIIVESLL